MYHRINGELVAIGVIDITQNYFNSGYFITKSKYSYLNLGVIGALIEIKYAQELKKLWLPSLENYLLGELVVDCPKVNYKLNYQPGEVLCPYTKTWVPFSVCKDEIYKIAKMTKKEKLEYSQDNICSNLPIKLNPSKDCEMHKFVDFLSEEFYKEAILKMEIIINGWQLKRLE